MRRILRKVAQNKPDELGDVSTLADPSVVEEIVQQHTKHMQEVRAKHGWGVPLVVWRDGNGEVFYNHDQLTLEIHQFVTSLCKFSELVFNRMYSSEEGELTDW